jgi:hypothetical protein
LLTIPKSPFQHVAVCANIIFTADSFLAFSYYRRSEVSFVNTKTKKLRLLVPFKAKYSKAVERMAKDRDVLLRFYDFPAKHWVHLCTTNTIESTFATVRLRTRWTHGCGSRMARPAMVFKLTHCAERHWYRLNSKELIAEIIQGVKPVDGIKEIAALTVTAPYVLLGGLGQNGLLLFLLPGFMTNI